MNLDDARELEYARAENEFRAELNARWTNFLEDCLQHSTLTARYLCGRVLIVETRRELTAFDFLEWVRWIEVREYAVIKEWRVIDQRYIAWRRKVTA